MKNISHSKDLVPQPSVIIGFYDSNGKARAIAGSWIGQMSKDEIQFLLMPRGNVKKLKSMSTFTVSFATKDTEMAFDYILMNPLDVNADNVENVGFMTSRSQNVLAPLFDGLPFVMECWLKQMVENADGSVSVWAYVANILCDEKYVTKDGWPDFYSMNIIGYDAINGCYSFSGGRVGKALADGKNRLNIIREKMLCLSKYDNSFDCFITPSIKTDAIISVRNNFRIEEDECVLLIRDTSSWLQMGITMGIVVTDKGVYFIADSKRKDLRTYIAWGDVARVCYSDKKVSFFDGDDKVIAEYPLNVLVKASEKPDEIGADLVRAFSGIANIIKKKESDKRKKEVLDRRRLRLFFNNFYTPFGKPGKSPRLRFIKVENGVMVVSYAPSAKVETAWRVAYITSSKWMSQTVIYAKVPGLEVLRKVFSFAISEDVAFKRDSFPNLSKAVARGSLDDGVRLAEREVDGKKVFLIAMTLNYSMDDVNKVRPPKELSYDVQIFMLECEKIIHDITRFMSYKRFGYYIEQLKKGRQPYESRKLAILVGLKCCWWGYKVYRAMNGGGNDNSDDGWIDNLLASGDVDVDTDNLDNLSSSIDYTNDGDIDLDHADFTPELSDPADFDCVGGVDVPGQDMSGFNADGHLNHGTSPHDNHCSIEAQPDGTAVVTDMFGAKYKCPSVNYALLNTDLTSGTPDYCISTSHHSSGISLHDGSGDLPTDVHTDVDLSFYDDKIKDSKDKYLEMTEKFRDAAANGNTDDMDFYDRQMKESKSSIDYWNDCRSNSEIDQKYENMRSDRIINDSNKAMNDLHQTILDISAGIPVK